METNINPNRGSIFDRNGQLLASSYTAYNIILDIRKLDERTDEVKRDTFEKINLHLEIPISELEGHLEKDSEGILLKDTHHYIIKKQVDKPTAFALVDSIANDVYLEAESLRSYTFETLASSILGFRRGDSYWGLEREYNSYLTGVPGRLLKTYSTASATVSTQIDPLDGYTLVTTLDTNIQRFADEAVLRAGLEYEPEKALAIVMNPQTGEVYAMSSYPMFSSADPFNFDYLGNDVLKAEYEALEQQEQLDEFYKTWANFNISGSFEPGSIFKPLVAAAALEENIITKNQTFFCSGQKQVAEYNIGCWKEGGHGTQTLSEALANSCNVAFMEVGMALGRDHFYEYQKNYGFGQKTGIDLPGELAGGDTLINTREKLNITELATGGMGQGFGCTSIQILTAFSSLVNGGNVMRPYVVSQVVDRNSRVIMQNDPKIVRGVISEETSSFLRRELQNVVSPQGTGRLAVIEGYNIGGKTGTGEQGVRGSDEHTVSFIGYMTVENPEYIAIVVIHKPKEYKEYMQGSTTAAPILKELLEKIIKYKGIKPSLDIDVIAGNNSTENSNFLINYEGLDTVYTTKSLNSLGINYEISGSGDIISKQMPKAGFGISEGLTVYLHLTSSNEAAETVSVPDVVGLPVQVAESILINAGFECLIVDVSGNAVIGTEETEGIELKIIRQMPSSGAKMLRGSQIKLVLP